MILGNGRRTDELKLSPCKRRLHDIGCIDGSFRSAGTDQGMYLIQEKNDISVIFNFPDDALDPLLEFSAVL